MQEQRPPKRFKPLKPLIAIVVAAILVCFQNCGKGFEIHGLSNSEENSSQSLRLQFKIRDQNFQIPTSQIDTQKKLIYEVDGKDYSARLQFEWTYEFDGDASLCHKIQDQQHNPSRFTISCDTEGILKVYVVATDGARTIELNDRREVVYGNEIPMTVDFLIPDGTNQKPWNTVAEKIFLFIGQTLKITNGDSIPHGLHTNGTPCASSPTLAPGGTYSCLVASAMDSGNSTSTTYDNIVGSAAPFYVRSYDPAQLYSQNCLQCHSALAQTTIQNKGYGDLRRALRDVPEMQDLNILSATELAAIAHALNN